ncbi:MAG: hypothetical protein L6R42_003115 [Xanthoria sp. 1 TBL-2021]|nr:MAG: hypothetical protein L6R42_003115 [Xanthoria sp. 1 TBL-2021]
MSPLALGTMNFGDAWAPIMGAMDKKTVFEVLDFYKDQGGNFIDAANIYQNEQSGMWIGEWLASKPGPPNTALATKPTKASTASSTPTQPPRSKSKKAQTRYIDIMFDRWWDFTTSISELMHSLNTVCDQGKVLYLGISDTPPGSSRKPTSTPAAKASANSSSTKAAGAPQTATSSAISYPCGNVKTEEQRTAVAGKGRNMAPPWEKDVKVSAALEKLAKAKNTILTSVALAYVWHKAPYVFPIVGGRKIEHLQGNIDALSVELSPEDLASPMAKSGAKGPKDVLFTDMSGKFDYVEGPFQFVLIRPAETWTGSRGTLLGMHGWHFENMDSGGGLQFISHSNTEKKASFRAVADGFQ